MATAHENQAASRQPSLFPREDPRALPEIPRVEVFNLLLLHLFPGLGKRRLLELVSQAPFLLSEPVTGDFWAYVEKSLRRRVKEVDRSGMSRDAEQTIARSDRGEFGILHLFMPGYPPLLKEIYDPPLALFFRGDPGLLSRDCVAVVGARKASDYGVAVAQDFAAKLAQAGLVVVSGMALGIDSAAHTGALKRCGKTVAVLGSGVDKAYPRQAGPVYAKIVAEGCVASEFLPGTYPAPQNFPIRNRIISGLCLGTLIVEATQWSGSLITARMSLEQGRELMAVPGPVHSPQSVGPNYLIKQGAKLVQIWQDVVEELPERVRKRLGFQPCASIEETQASRPLGGLPEKHPLTNDQERVYNCLFFDRKVQIGDLLERSGMSVGILGGVLLALESDGWIHELPGHYFIKSVR